MAEEEAIFKRHGGPATCLEPGDMRAPANLGKGQVTGGLMVRAAYSM